MTENDLAAALYWYITGGQRYVVGLFGRPKAHFRAGDKTRCGREYETQWFSTTARPDEVCKSCALALLRQRQLVRIARGEGV